MSALALATKPAGQSTDDLDLVAAFRAGDDRAFTLLYARYESRISAYVRGKVRDHGRAEDITQEVFIAAFRRMRETDREILFKPWIYEIAKNACIDAFRRTRNIDEVSFDADSGLGPADHRRLAAAASGPDAVVDAKDALDSLCGAFGGLNDDHRRLLAMREFEGRSYREIGELMGMSQASVESSLWRARRQLGKEYDEIVSGERCRRVRAIADGPAGRGPGKRNKSRLARHISHCQPCRRYALHAGVDIAALRPLSAVAKIAGWLPLPAFVRRRLGVDEAGQASQVLGAHGAPVLNVMSTVDPTIVSSWSKAIVTVATVAVAGLGTGAAVKHDVIQDFVSGLPSFAGLAEDRPGEHSKLPRIDPRATAVAPVAGPGRSGGPILGGDGHDAAGTATAPEPQRRDGAITHPGGAGSLADDDVARGSDGLGRVVPEDQPSGGSSLAGTSFDLYVGGDDPLGGMPGSGDGAGDAQIRTQLSESAAAQAPLTLVAAESGDEDAQGTAAGSSLVGDGRDAVTSAPQTKADPHEAKALKGAVSPSEQAEALTAPSKDPVVVKDPAAVKGPAAVKDATAVKGPAAVKDAAAVKGPAGLSKDPAAMKGPAGLSKDPAAMKDPAGLSKDPAAMKDPAGANAALAAERAKAAARQAEVAAAAADQVPAGQQAKVAQSGVQVAAECARDAAIAAEQSKAAAPASEAAKSAALASEQAREAVVAAQAALGVAVAAERRSRTRGAELAGLSRMPGSAAAGSN